MLELAKKWKRVIDMAFTTLKEASTTGSSLQVSSRFDSLLLEKNEPSV